MSPSKRRRLASENDQVQASESYVTPKIVPLVVWAKAFSASSELGASAMLREAHVSEYAASNSESKRRLRVQ